MVVLTRCFKAWALLICWTQSVVELLKSNQLPVVCLIEEVRLEVRTPRAYLQRLGDLGILAVLQALESLRIGIQVMKLSENRVWI